MRSHRTNADRVTDAATAVAAYQEGYHSWTAEEVLIDLLADLTHWADARNVNFGDAADAAKAHHAAERSEGVAS